MDVPINAEVYCADGLCGHSTRVVINPTTQQVTHLVVKESQEPYAQRLVGVDLVVESTPHSVHLRCTKEELAAMESFVEYEFVRGVVPYVPYEAEQYVLAPYALPIGLIPVEHERIPPGELAVRRGARVEARDGLVGRVDEFLVDPQNGHITHLVLREGHLWGQRDVTIPVSEIARIVPGTVYLKLDKAGVEALPSVPVKR